VVYGFAERNNENVTMSDIVENATPEKTREWFPVFLATLRNTANVRASCQAAKIDRRTAYRNREENADFRAAWDEAIEDACDQLEASAWLRAKGSSDTLMIFLLKAHRPAKYRETTKTINVNVTPEQVAKMSDEELEAYLKQAGLL
jgi:hemerythrin superfamily protein